MKKVYLQYILDNMDVRNGRWVLNYPKRCDGPFAYSPMFGKFFRVAVYKNRKVTIYTNGEGPKHYRDGSEIGALILIRYDELIEKERNRKPNAIQIVLHWFNSLLKSCKSFAR